MVDDTVPAALSQDVPGYGLQGPDAHGVTRIKGVTTGEQYMKAWLIASAMAMSLALSGCIGYIHDNGRHRDDRPHDSGHYDSGPHHDDGHYGPDRDRRYSCPPGRNC